MRLSKVRIPGWLPIILAVGVLLAALQGTWWYTTATVPLHPDPQKVPFATERFPSSAWAGAVDQGRQIARASLAEQNLPGLAVAIGVGGDIVWAEGFGWANVEKRVPVAPHTRFRIGHVSKALTSAAVGLLVEKDRLHLNDEIQKYVPAFPRKQWPITLGQLMGHTAGIRHYLGEEADIPSGHCERASEGLQSFADDPLLFEPETQSRYSTYGWVLVSAAVEAVANEPFFTFMRTQIFTPLGMTDTTPDSATEPMPDRTTFYFPKFSGDNQFGHEVAKPVDYSCFAGAGAFLSTPVDLVQFGMGINGRLRQGSGVQGGPLLQPDTVRRFQTPQTLTSGKDTEFGLGWMLETIPLGGEPTRLASDASRSLLGASASFLTFPERGLVVAVTSNTSYAGTRSIALKLAEVFAAQAARQKGK